MTDVEYIRGESREHDPPQSSAAAYYMDDLGRVWEMRGYTLGLHYAPSFRLSHDGIDLEESWSWWNKMVGPMHDAIPKPPRALEQPPDEDDLATPPTAEQLRREARIQELIDRRWETTRVKEWRWLLDQRHVGLLDISLDSKTEEARRAGVDVLAFPRPWPVQTLDPNVTVSRLTKPYDGAMNPLPEAQHLPVFDLDLPAYTIPSSTPGHSHLYINRPISTEHYQAILDAFVQAGLVQEGFARRLDVDGYCTLRLPWVRKEIDEPEPGQEPPRPPAPPPPPVCDVCHGFGRTTVDDIHTGGYREVDCPICSEPPFL